MLLHITDVSAEPMHEQISRQITDKIIDGDLFGGMALPPMRRFARNQHVSIQTVRRAFEELMQDGLITSRNGHRYVVALLKPDQKQAIALQRSLGRQSPLNIVEEFSKKLISVFDPKHLRDLFRDIVKTSLGISDACFFITEEQSVVLVADDSPEHNPTNVSLDDPIVQRISRLRLPVRVTKLFANGEMHPLYNELNRRNIRVIVPLNEHDQLLGFIGITDKKDCADFNREDMNLLLVLANQFTTALTTARFYVEAVEKRRLEEELVIAQQIQADLLPKSLPDHDAFSVAAYSEASHMVGGDFYDYLPFGPKRFGLVIGDACGDGLPAAMLISQIQAMLRSEVNNGVDIEPMCEYLNRQVFRFTPRNKFVTLFYGVYDHNCHEFHYANAGHHYPIIIRKDGSTEELNQGGPGLGILEGAEYSTGSVKLNPEDLLVLYTDGISETLNDAQREDYGERRLVEQLIYHRHEHPNKIVKIILDDMQQFGVSDSSADDRTLVVVKFGEQ